MRIVEGEIGSKKISFRSVNCSAAPSEVKHQVLYVEKDLDDEREVEEGEEDDIQLLEPGEYAPEALEAAEEPLNFIALFVQLAVVLPGIEAVGFGRDDRDHAQIEHGLPRLIPLVGFVQYHRKSFRHRSRIEQQLAATRRIVFVARRQRQSYCRSSIRGKQMNLAGPSAAGFADGLRPVFLTPRCRPDAP